MVNYDKWWLSLNACVCTGVQPAESTPEPTPVLNPVTTSPTGSREAPKTASRAPPTVPQSKDSGHDITTISTVTTTSSEVDVVKNSTVSSGSDSGKSGAGAVVDKGSVVVAPSGDEGGEQEDVCGRYGCDGSGIVAVVVVAVICFAIVLVVVAIMVKKAVDQRRKRKFRNVDYLINGMYT